MAGSYTAHYYHIVFSTKDRQPFLTSDVAPRIHDYLGALLSHRDGISIVVGGVADHIHLLGALSKNRSIAETMRELKAISSGWIHQSFSSFPHFAWQEGYGAFSISVAGLDRVKQYIQEQEAHHRTVSFQEEFLEFLHRHQIPYDERYIWT